MTDTTQVLTFSLGEEEYCVPIDYVAEIVGNKQIQSVPNTEGHIEGVTDLRGETTTIVDPSKLLSVETEELATDGGSARKWIIILDADSLDTESLTGWLVSGVREVTAVLDDSVDMENTADSDYIRGLVKGDATDNFTLWLDPHELTA